MKRIALTIMMIAALLVMNAQVRTYSLDIKDFSEMTIANSVNVVYRSVADSAGIAIYTCAPEVASALTFANDKGKLKIQVANDKPLQQLPTITVYSMALSKVSNWGDSLVVVEKLNPGITFKANVIGNGRIEVDNVVCTKVEASVEAGQGHVYLTGKSQNAKYTIMSAGAVEAGELQAAQVKCMMAGTGAIDCYATEKLTVVGLGSGHVYYRGNPAVKNRCIGVKINKID